MTYSCPSTALPKESNKGGKAVAGFHCWLCVDQSLVAFNSCFLVVQLGVGNSEVLCQHTQMDPSQPRSLRVYVQVSHNQILVDNLRPWPLQIPSIRVRTSVFLLGNPFLVVVFFCRESQGRTSTCWLQPNAESVFVLGPLGTLFLRLFHVSRNCFSLDAPGFGFAQLNDSAKAKEWRRLQFGASKSEMRRVVFSCCDPCKSLVVSFQGTPGFIHNTLVALSLGAGQMTNGGLGQPFSGWCDRQGMRNGMSPLNNPTGGFL